MTLLELMQKHQTNKASQRFDIPYQRFLDERRHQVTSVLEIGVKRGASLRVWEEYFPNAKIFGVDVVPKFARYATPRSQIFIGSQSDPELLSRVAAAAGYSFDLIVDDGSHVADDQVASLMFLWPFLKPAHGIYAIEDLHAHLRYTPHAKMAWQYPPMSEMLLQLMAGSMSRKRCRETVPGISIYGPMALLAKHTDGPPPKFARFAREGVRAA